MSVGFENFVKTPVKQILDKELEFWYFYLLIDIKWLQKPIGAKEIAINLTVNFIVTTIRNGTGSTVPDFKLHDNIIKIWGEPNPNLENCLINPS